MYRRAYGRARARAGTAMAVQIVHLHCRRRCHLAREGIAGISLFNPFRTNRRCTRQFWIAGAIATTAWRLFNELSE